MRPASWMLHLGRCRSASSVRWPASLHRLQYNVQVHSMGATRSWLPTPLRPAASKIGPLPFSPTGREWTSQIFMAATEPASTGTTNSLPTIQRCVPLCLPPPDHRHHRHRHPVRCGGVGSQGLCGLSRAPAWDGCHPSAPAPARSLPRAIQHASRTWYHDAAWDKRMEGTRCPLQARCPLQTQAST